MMGAADRPFLDSYLAAWKAHDAAAVARHMADDAIYEDVALGRCTARPRLRRSSRRPPDHRATSDLNRCRWAPDSRVTRS
jgi:ketosteroid isomerase-like protein